MSSSSFEYSTLIEKYNNNAIMSLDKVVSEFKSVKSGNPSKSSLERVKKVIVGNIQNTIKTFLEEIESPSSQGKKKTRITTSLQNKKKKELNDYMNSLEKHWQDLKEIFQVADETLLTWLKDNVEQTLFQINQHHDKLAYSDLLEDITNSIEYWPTNKVSKFLKVGKKIGISNNELWKTLKAIHLKNTVENIKRISDLRELQGLTTKFPLLKDKTCPQTLLDQYVIKLNELKQDFFITKLTAELEELEQGIITASYWNQSIEEEFIRKIALISDLPLKEQYFKKLYKLFKLYTLSDDSVLFRKVPELTQGNKSVPIRYTHDGLYSLYALTEKGWIPAYSWANNKIFPKLTFEQEGEWKYRKFKCSSWTLSGHIPLGTILRLNYKKEIIYFIVSDQGTLSNTFRELQLEDDQINKIQNLLTNVDLETSSSGEIDIYQLNIPELQDIFCQLFSSSISAKIGLNIYIKDKMKETFIFKLFFVLFSKNNESKEKEKVIKIFLSNFCSEKDKKYINVVHRCLRSS